MTKNDNILVRKITPQGDTEITWEGEVLERRAAYLKIEARFQRADRIDLGYAAFERNDRFVEWFFSDRWYTIFEVHARKDDRLKGWYCNIARPAEIRANEVCTHDLALDLWVAADGAMAVLDEDEFAGLRLTAADRNAARAALKELQQAVETRRPPFHLI